MSGDKEDIKRKMSNGKNDWRRRMASRDGDEDNQKRIMDDS